MNSTQAVGMLERSLETDVTMFLSHDSHAFIQASNASRPLHVDLLGLSRFLLFHSEQRRTGMQPRDAWGGEELPMDSVSEPVCPLVCRCVCVRLCTRRG